jgi:hypothetical protein
MAYFAYFMDDPTIKFKGNFMEKMGVAENKYMREKPIEKGWSLWHWFFHIMLYILYIHVG